MASSAATLPGLLRTQAHERGSDTVYTYLADGEQEERSVTFGELDVGACAIAARLQRECKPGDRALILTPGGIEFARAFMACQHAGVIAVPAYPPFPLQSEPRVAALRAIARDCRPSIVLTAGPVEFRELVAAVAPEMGALHWLRVDTVPAEGAGELRPVNVGGDDVALLQYTSGSTSLPRGVVVTQEALMRNEELIHRSFRLGSEDVLIGWLPLFHDMGLIGNLLHTLYAGARATSCRRSRLCNDRDGGCGPYPVTAEP